MSEAVTRAPVADSVAAGRLAKAGHSPLQIERKLGISAAVAGFYHFTALDDGSRKLSMRLVPHWCPKKFERYYAATVSEQDEFVAARHVRELKRGLN